MIFFVSDIIKSAIGLSIWIAGLTTWIVIFQNNRAAWGAFADQISFLIPLGKP
jgi:presenilin enhancer 2